MKFEDKVSAAVGKLMIAIGEGKFRERLAVIILEERQEAYQAGVEAGIRKDFKAKLGKVEVRDELENN